MKKLNFNLPMTITLLQSSACPGYTAYFKQLPEIIAEGDNEDEAVQNLLNAVYDVFKYEGEKKSVEINNEGMHIQNKSVNLTTYVCA
jgi:hypothetical protein